MFAAVVLVLRRGFGRRRRVVVRVCRWVWMVVRFVCVIRRVCPMCVPAPPVSAPVCPVCPVCVPAPPGVRAPVCPVCPECVPAPPGVAP